MERFKIIILLRTGVPLHCIVVGDYIFAFMGNVKALMIIWMYLQSLIESVNK